MTRLRLTAALTSLLYLSCTVCPPPVFAQLLRPVSWTPPAATSSATQTVRFVYDGDGGRVKQVTPSGTTTYLGEVYEKGPSGVTTKSVFAGSLRLAAKDSTGALRFYHPDHLGSSNVITDGTGAVVEVTEHTPYGALSRHEGAANVAQKFTGQRLDTDTGLYCFQARYYDPTLGRFVSADSLVQDPSDPQTLNRYSYVRNNPLRYTDPSGNFFFLAALGFIFAAAAIAGTIGAAIKIGVSFFRGKIHNASDFFRAGGTGFAAGAAAGATGALGALILGPAISGSLLGSIALGASSGAIGGGVGSVMGGGSFGQGAGWGALSGGVLASVGNVAGPYLAQTRIGQAVGRLTDPITSRLGNLYNQALAPRYSGIDGFLTRVQFRVHTSLARARTLWQAGPLSWASDRVTIYRGIGRGHPGYEDALKGIVDPFGGHESPYHHNMGNTRSEFTSWTTSRAVAERFAEGDGIVLQMTVDKSRLIFTPDYFSENEVLLRGPASGAQVNDIDQR